MNINDHFRRARLYLDLAKAKFEEQDFVAANLEASKSFSHSSAILHHIYYLALTKAITENTN